MSIRLNGDTTLRSVENCLFRWHHTHRFVVTRPTHTHTRARAHTHVFLVGVLFWLILGYEEGRNYCHVVEWKALTRDWGYSCDLRFSGSCKGWTQPQSQRKKDKASVGLGVSRPLMPRHSQHHNCLTSCYMPAFWVHHTWRGPRMTMLAWTLSTGSISKSFVGGCLSQLTVFNTKMNMGWIMAIFRMMFLHRTTSFLQYFIPT